MNNKKPRLVYSIGLSSIALALMDMMFMMHHPSIGIGMMMGGGGPGMGMMKHGMMMGGPQSSGGWP